MAFFCSVTTPAPAGTSIAQVVAGVMRNAQAGELPLFAWTLGLPQAELLQAVATLFPDLDRLTPLTAHEYAILQRGRPAGFDAIVALLLAHRATSANGQHAKWLAHAIAAAAPGERHLWHDLGLAGPAALSALLRQYFPTLHGRNVHRMQWKRFLYAAL